MSNAQPVITYATLGKMSLWEVLGVLMEKSGRQLPLKFELRNNSILFGAKSAENAAAALESVVDVVNTIAPGALSAFQVDQFVQMASALRRASQQICDVVQNEPSLTAAVCSALYRYQTTNASRQAQDLANSELPNDSPAS